MQLPKNLDAFSWFFIAFSQSSLNVDHFEKKDEPHRSRFPEVIHSERRVYLHT